MLEVPLGGGTSDLPVAESSGITIKFALAVEVHEAVNANKFQAANTVEMRPIECPEIEHPEIEHSKIPYSKEWQCSEDMFPEEQTLECSKPMGEPRLARKRSVSIMIQPYLGCA